MSQNSPSSFPFLCVQRQNAPYKGMIVVRRRRRDLQLIAPTNIQVRKIGFYQCSVAFKTRTHPTNALSLCDDVGCDLQLIAPTNFQVFWCVQNQNAPYEGIIVVRRRRVRSSVDRTNKYSSAKNWFLSVFCCVQNQNAPYEGIIVVRRRRVRSSVDRTNKFSSILVRSKAERTLQRHDRCATT